MLENDAEVVEERRRSVASIGSRLPRRSPRVGEISFDGVDEAVESVGPAHLGGVNGLLAFANELVCNEEA